MLLGTFLGRISKPRTITTPSPAPAARRTRTTTTEDGRTWQARSPGAVHLGDVVRGGRRDTDTIELDFAPKTLVELTNLEDSLRK